MTLDDLFDTKLLIEQKKYQNATKNILGNIQISILNSKPVRPWESRRYYFNVPACLEFIGLSNEIEKRLVKKNLLIYFDNFDFEYIPDFFLEYDYIQKINLLENMSMSFYPLIFASLSNYHNSRFCLKGQIKNINRWTLKNYYLENSLSPFFSKELIELSKRRDKTWVPKNYKNAKKMIDIELLALESLSNAVKSEFKF